MFFGLAIQRQPQISQIAQIIELPPEYAAVADIDEFMDTVRRFEHATSAALEEFKRRSGMQDPFGAWMLRRVPQLGELPGHPPLKYAFHGIGLRLDGLGAVIDFDFGPNGIVGGFNRWWLHVFARNTGSPARYADDANTVGRDLEVAARLGLIIRPFTGLHDGLWYRSDRPEMVSAKSA